MCGAKSFENNGSLGRFERFAKFAEGLTGLLIKNVVDHNSSTQYVRLISKAC